MDRGRGGVVHGGMVDGSIMEWIGRGGSTWWGGRRVCHGVDRGGVVPGGVVDGSVMEWIGGGGVVPGGVVDGSVMEWIGGWEG